MRIKKTMKKTFEFSFEDLSENNGISYEIDSGSKLSYEVYNGQHIIYLNKNGALALSKMLAQIGVGDYEDGFHLHLHENFDDEKPEVLTVILDSTL